MRLLLDTHAFLWFIAADPQLSNSARALIEDNENDLLLSMASIWEIAIKVGLGKLSIPQPIESFLPSQLQHNDIDLLPIEMVHAIRVAGLPFHHRDPFDRLLIVQGLMDGLPIVGRDASFDAYGVERIW